MYRDKAIISVVSAMSVASLVYGVVASFTDPVEATGYISSSLFAGACVLSYKELILRKNISEAADQLKEENQHLKIEVLQLEKNINSMGKEVSAFRLANSELADDIDMLKTTVGIVGVKGELFIQQLRLVYDDLKRENNRQNALVKRQTCLHICQLMQHLDSNNDAVLDEVELHAARSYIKMMIPNLDIKTLESALVDGKIDLKSLLEHLSI